MIAMILVASVGQFSGQLTLKRDIGPMFQYQTREAIIRNGANLANFPLPVWVDQHGVMVSYIPAGNSGLPNLVSIPKPPPALVASRPAKVPGVGQRMLLRAHVKRGRI